MLQSLHQRLIALETLQIDEKLSEQSDFLFGNPSVADQLKEIHQRIDNLENQARDSIDYINNKTEQGLNQLHDTCLTTNAEVENISSTISAHLYFVQNANPHPQLPSLPPLDETYQHIFSGTWGVVAGGPG